ncbi:MAG: tetratricopeptide repeat protein [Planctomycetota bacterium]|nr:tetratricopeptide repeat protein [Planctomycetota bacterium]
MESKSPTPPEPAPKGPASRTPTAVVTKVDKSSPRKKKRKVNAKFLATVSSITVLGIGLILVFAYLQITRAPLRNVAMGDSLMAEGKYEEALERYGRAVRKAPNDAAYLAKMEEALLKIQPDSQTRSNQLFGQWLQILSQSARVTDGGKNAAAWRRVTNLLTTLGDTKGLEGAADLMASRFPKEDSTNQLEARRIQAIASTLRMLGDQMGEAESSQALEEIKAVVAADPSDIRATGWYLRALVQQATQARTTGIVSRERAAREAAKAAIDAAELVHGACPLPVAMRYLVLADQRRADPTMDTAPLDAAAEGVLQSIAASVAGAYDLTQLMPADARMVIESLRQQNSPEAREAMRAMLERSSGLGGTGAVELELARAAFTTDPDGARARLKAVLHAPRPPVGIDAIQASTVKADAASLLAKVTLAQYEAARDTPQGPPLREEVLAQVAELEAMVREDSSMADAAVNTRIALASMEGDSARVLELGLPLINRTTLPNREAAVHVGIAYMRRNEPGQALQVAERALRSSEMDFDLTLLQGQALLAMGRVSEAGAIVNRLERVSPTGVQVRALRQSIVDRIATGVAPTDTATDPIVLAINDLIALEAKGDRDAAVQGAQSLSAQVPADRRVMLYRIQMLVRQGQRDAALAALESFIAANPDQATELAAARAAITEEDPVRRIDAVLRTQDLSDDEFLLRRIPLLQVEFEQSARAVAEEPEEARRAERQQSLEAVRQARDAARADLKARALTTDEALEIRLLSAIDEHDDAEVSAVLEAAGRSSNKLLAGMFRGRRAEIAEDWPAAIREYQTVVADPTAPLLVTNRLAEAYLESGRIAEAQALLADSYRRRPSDAETARRYATILQRMGKQNEALTVLRDASQANPREPSLRAGWLALEGLYGNKGDVVQMRRQLLRTSPGDLQNVRALVTLLCVVTPSPDLAIDARGNPRLSTAIWSAMNLRQQASELQRIRGELLREAEDYTDSLLQLNPSDFEAVAGLAAGLHRSGEVERAAVMLEKSAKRAGGDVAARMWLAAAESRAILGDDAAFDRLMAQARTKASRSDRVFDMLVGRLLTQRNDIAGATEAFERGAASCRAQMQSDPKNAAAAAGLYGYLIEEFVLFARTRNRAGMERIIAEIKANETDQTPATTKANRVRREIDALVVRSDEEFSSGDVGAVAQTLQQVQALTDEALRLEPGDASPLLVRSQLARRAFGRTGDRASLDDAVAALEEARKIAPGAWRITAEAVRVHLAREERATAIAELTHYLQLDPESMQARERLAGVYRLMGDQTAAIAVWDDALKADALRVDFMRAKGDLLTVFGRHGEAGAAYEQAFVFGSRVEDLVRAVQGRLLASPMDAPAVLGLLASHEALLATNLMLRSARAAARYYSGLQADAISSLRDIWRQNQAAGSAGESEASWFLAVNSIFPHERNADLESFVLDTTHNKPTTLTQIGLAQAWLRSPSGGAKSLEWAEKALTDQSQPPAVRAVLFTIAGQAVGSMGSWEEAAARFESALAESPRNPIALNNLAYVEAKRLGRLEQALEHARLAIEFSSSPNAEYLDTLGYVLMLTGHLDEASTHLDAAVELSPSSSIILHQAMIRKAQGREDEAKLLSQRALTLATGDEEKTEAQEFIDSLASATTGAERSK